MLIRRTVYPAGLWRGTLDEMDKLRQDMGRFLSSFSGDTAPAGSTGVFPLLNVSEDAEKFTVEAELPGMAAEDLDITITGKNLSIKGARKPPEPPEGARFHRRERGFPSFSRAIGLPSEVDSGKVEAKFIDGVLTLVIPKAEALKPRQITVSAS